MWPTLFWCRSLPACWARTLVYWNRLLFDQTWFRPQQIKQAWPRTRIQRWFLCNSTENRGRLSIGLIISLTTFYLINPQQPKVFGVKFSLGKIRRTFPIILRNFERWKMPKLLNFRFPEECYFFKFDNTELKRFSNIFFSVSERHRWAVVG